MVDLSSPKSAGISRGTKEVDCRFRPATSKQTWDVAVGQLPTNPIRRVYFASGSALCRAAASRRPDDGEKHNFATGCVNSAITTQPDHRECAQPPAPTRNLILVFGGRAHQTTDGRRRRGDEDDRGAICPLNCPWTPLGFRLAWPNLCQSGP